jgi:hypothetical protein
VGAFQNAPRAVELTENLGLVVPLGEQDEERTEGEDRQNGNDGPRQAALLHGFHEAELVLGAAPAAARI